jgi:hypothetical protein
MTNKHGKRKEPFKRLSFFVGVVVGITATCSFLLAVVLLDKM